MSVRLIPLRSGRPGRGYSAHAGIGDGLAHVFVVVDQDTEEDIGSGDVGP